MNLSEFSSITERFMRYVKYDTQSDYESKTYPSTAKQLDFARVLVEECKQLGLADVKLDEYGYVTATLPASEGVEAGPNAHVIGFLAHMDTSPDASGANVKPRLIKDYDGSAIELGTTRVLSPDEFPHLKECVGKDLIVTDGTTLLGGDDKAGIAIIMSMMEYLIAHPEIKHGKLRIGFTPDEEVGKGVEYFDVKAFGADFGYTIDGGGIGGMEIETFNAADLSVEIIGKSVHPGGAKSLMKNAGLIAAELAGNFPIDETPQTTEGYEGYFHLTRISGSVEHATAKFLIRDFDKENFERRKQRAAAFVEAIKAKYDVEVNYKITDSYYNMRNTFEGKEYIIDRAKKAISAAGIEPTMSAIRGGTDGARLSFMGLPCPNFFTGAYNGHGPYEHVCVQSMQKAVEVAINIAKCE